MKKTLFIAVLGCLVFSCSVSSGVNEKKQKESSSTSINANAPLIIYKTKNDYSNYVPISLSADKSRIMSYPGPEDVVFNGNLAYPTLLEKGYYLDNIGISSRVAYLKYTLEAYSELNSAPTLQEMFDNILDDDPLLEYYDCGSRQTVESDLGDISHVEMSELLQKCDCLVNQN